MKQHSERLFSTIFNTWRIMRQRIYDDKCFADFSQADLEVLKIVRDKKKMTMKSIAEHLHIKPSSVTPIIENLVGKKQLKRTPDKEDRRTIYITLNEKGRKNLQKKHEVAKKTINEMFSKLSEKEKKELITILDKILQENHEKNT